MLSHSAFPLARKHTDATLRGHSGSTWPPRGHPTTAMRGPPNGHASARRAVTWAKGRPPITRRMLHGASVIIAQSREGRSSARPSTWLGRLRGKKNTPTAGHVVPPEGPRNPHSSDRSRLARARRNGHDLRTYIRYRAGVRDSESLLCPGALRNTPSVRLLSHGYVLLSHGALMVMISASRSL